MKILIIGSLGALGQQLTKVFQQAGDEITGWDAPEFQLVQPESLNIPLQQLNPDVIINAAAYNAVDKCETDPAEQELAQILNHKLPHFLAAWAAAAHKILIHYSTDYVFSGLADYPLEETAKPDPINYYGASKAAGEKAITSTAGLNYYLIRTSKLFGPKGGSPFAKDSFFEVMKRLAESQPELNVVSDELSCFTYTPDLAQATLKLVAEKQPYGIYHIVNPPAATWYDGVLALKELAGLSVLINPISGDTLKRPARRPLNSALVNTKTPALRDYREALKEYLDNY